MSVTSIPADTSSVFSGEEQSPPLVSLVATATAAPTESSPSVSQQTPSLSPTIPADHPLSVVDVDVGAVTVSPMSMSLGTNAQSPSSSRPPPPEAEAEAVAPSSERTLCALQEEYNHLTRDVLEPLQTTVVAERARCQGRREALERQRKEQAAHHLRLSETLTDMETRLLTMKQQIDLYQRCWESMVEPFLVQLEQAKRKTAEEVRVTTQSVNRTRELHDTAVQALQREERALARVERSIAALHDTNASLSTRLSEGKRSLEKLREHTAALPPTSPTAVVSPTQWTSRVPTELSFGPNSNLSTTFHPSPGEEEVLQSVLHSFNYSKDSLVDLVPPLASPSNLSSLALGPPPLLQHTQQRLKELYAIRRSIDELQIAGEQCRALRELRDYWSDKKKRETEEEEVSLSSEENKFTKKNKRTKRRLAAVSFTSSEKHDHEYEVMVGDQWESVKAAFTYRQKEWRKIRAELYALQGEV